MLRDPDGVAVQLDEWREGPAPGSTRRVAQSKGA
jgi:hypothetical protein